MWLMQKLHGKAGTLATLRGVKALGVTQKRRCPDQQRLLVQSLSLLPLSYRSQVTQPQYQPRLSRLQQQQGLAQAVTRLLHRRHLSQPQALPSYRLQVTLPPPQSAQSLQRVMRVSARLQETLSPHRLLASLRRQQQGLVQAVMRRLPVSVALALKPIKLFQSLLMRLRPLLAMSLSLPRQGLKSLAIKLKHLQQVFWYGVLWTQAKHLTGLQFQVHKHLVGVRWIPTRLLIGKR